MIGVSAGDVHQQRLHLRRHVGQRRAARDDIAPRGLVDLPAGRPGRARVVGVDGAVGAGDEEGQADRHAQTRGGHLRQAEASAGYEPVVPVAGGLPVEQQRARLADAADLVAVGVEQVPMLVGQLHRAQVAALAHRSRTAAGPADDAAQRIGHRRRSSPMGDGAGRISASSGTKVARARAARRARSVTLDSSGTAVSTASRTVCSMSADRARTASLQRQPHDRHRLVAAGQLDLPPWAVTAARSPSITRASRVSTDSGWMPCSASRCRSARRRASVRRAAGIGELQRAERGPGRRSPPRRPPGARPSSLIGPGMASSWSSCSLSAREQRAYRAVVEPGGRLDARLVGGGVSHRWPRASASAASPGSCRCRGTCGRRRAGTDRSCAPFA